VTGLQEGKPYKFRVKAVNKEGESEELETEKPIIAKNPFGELRIPCFVRQFKPLVPAAFTGVNIHSIPKEG
jgi:hypothetical protein